MCLVALAIGQSARFPLVLVSNRDEFFDRPTSALNWWRPAPDGPEVLSGRDLQAGGSWLGLSATGRLALVTNVRDGLPPAPGAPSRGSLVTDWLVSSEAFEPHWARLAGAGHNGFNLIAADLARGEWHWAGNRGGNQAASGGGSARAARAQAPVPQRLPPGLHGLSNATLDTPWPKVQRLKAAVQAALEGAEAGRAQAHDLDHGVREGGDAALSALVERLFAALGDNRPADDALLPATGLPLELERQLSAAFIRTPDGRYGTRCSTLVVTEVTTAGPVTHVIERSFGGDRIDGAISGLAPCVERCTWLGPGFAGAAARGRGREGERVAEPITERALPT